MKVDIWSDIRCPFCYIGKRHFEKALENFPHKNEIEVVWHSFELDPFLVTAPETSSLEHFVKSKNIGVDQAKEMFDNVTAMAKNAGLNFNLEHQKVANSLKAHLLIQFAKSKDLADEMKEALLKAQLIEGKNIDDEKTLVEIANQFSLGEEEVINALNSEELRSLVLADNKKAQQLGITGVPFFVFDDKYGVSGAQPTEIFLETLQNSYQEYSDTKPELKIVASGESCDPEGNC